MAIPASLVIIYLLATTILGLLAARGGQSAKWRQSSMGRRPAKDGPPSEDRKDYVLGGARAGAFVLFATMAASNFSAFTVFGLSGAGYRLGWAYYPAMGFGTGLMALSFIFLGMPLRRLAAARGYLSPADFVADRYGSPLLAKGFSLALIGLTLPYLATQAVAGGRMLELLTGLPYPLASLAIVAVTALYTTRGGFRAVAATDALQLAVLLGGAAAAFLAVLSMSGGLPAAAARLAAASPAHLSRLGAGGGLSLPSLLGLWLLWALADPLFPQLFQRFYAAKYDASLKRAAVLYPVVTGGLFLLTIGVGVVGASLLPGLQGKETEQVFTRLALASGSPAAGALFAIAALAALMSTMDSQLLSLSSMIVQDFLPAGRRRAGTDALLVLLLSAAAYAISLAPPTLILEALTGAAFPGYAALAPVVWAGLYSRRAEARGAALATLAGLGLVGLEAGKLLSFGPVPAVAANLAIQLLLLAASAAFEARRGEGAARGAAFRAAGSPRPGEAAGGAWLLALLALAAAGSLFWSYGTGTRLVLGAPSWVWASLGTTLLLSLLYAAWRPRTARTAAGRRGSRPGREAPPALFD